MKHRNLLLLTAAVVVASSFVSCDILESLLGTSIETRIDLFEADLNKEGQTGIVNHFADGMEDKAALEDGTVFDGSPLSYANEPITIGPPVATAADANVVNCTFENGIGGTGTITFTMQKVGYDYVIRRIDLTIDGSTITTTFKRLAGGR